MQKHGSATAFPTVQLELQVRGKDVSLPYHHALTVSSLGSDCQARTAPLLKNSETKKLLISGNLESGMKIMNRKTSVSSLKAAVIFRFHLSEFGRFDTVLLGVFTHTPREGGK